ncbi:MAG: extracellular solute-binding protein [Chloroflexota bacterium]
MVTEDVEAGNGGVTEAIDQVNAEFMAKYPNVTIKRIKTTFEDLQTKQPLEVTAPNPPDVFQIVVPSGPFANFGNAGLILNLDDYAAQYGWVDRSGPLLHNSRFDSSGQVGTGPLYALPQLEEIVGVYYNKEKLAALKLQVPGTWDEFLASLDAAKGAGEIPIMVGTSGQGHLYAMVYNRYVTSADINGWTEHTAPDVSFDSAGWLEAARVFQKWGTGGYLEPDFNAVAYDDAWKRFAAGEGLYLPVGIWLHGGIADAGGDKIGFFLPPASKEVPALQVQGGGGQPWAISAASKHPDCGAAYLEFMTSQRGGEILIEHSAHPGFKMETVPTIPAGLDRDLVEALNTVNGSYTLSTFEGTATATLGPVIRALRQELLANRITPEEFVKGVQAEYEKG